jgi:hypothetical protein
LRLHQRIDEAPADGGVVDLGRALERFRGLAHDERRPRHRFDAAGDGEVDLAGADGAARRADRIEAGGAQAVHGDAGDTVRQAREQQRHPGHVAVVLARLVGAAEIDLVDFGKVDLGIAGDERLDRLRREIVGTHPRKAAAIAPDRRSHRIADEDIAHVHCSLMQTRWRRCAPAGFSNAVIARLDRTIQ